MCGAAPCDPALRARAVKERGRQASRRRGRSPRPACQTRRLRRPGSGARALSREFQKTVGRARHGGVRGVPRVQGGGGQPVDGRWSVRGQRSCPRRPRGIGLSTGDRDPTQRGCIGTASPRRGLAISWRAAPLDARARSAHALHRVRREGLKPAWGLGGRDNFGSSKDNSVALEDRKSFVFVF